MINAGLDRSCLFRFTFARSFFVSGISSELFLKVLLYSVEDPVDKLCSFVGGETPCDLKGFIYDDCVRGRLKKELVDRKAEDVAVHNRHPFDAPVFRAGPDLVIDLGKAFERTEHEIVGELARRQIDLRTELAPEIIDQTLPAHIGHIRGEKHL